MKHSYKWVPMVLLMIALISCYRDDIINQDEDSMKDPLTKAREILERYEVVKYSPLLKRCFTTDMLAPLNNGRLLFELLCILPNDDSQKASGHVTRTYYYDKKGRQLQMVENYLHIGTISRYTNKYDFTDRILTTLETHTDSKGNTNTKRTDYTYDRYGRVMTEKTTVNDLSPVTITFTYDELGNVASKTFGATGVTETYTYNLQGAITSQDSKRMSREYVYDTPATGYYNKPRYDGNLSMVKWRFKTTTPKDEAYVYDYDRWGQLSSGLYYVDAQPAQSHDERVQYDANGNITRMQRTGTYKITCGDFSYAYDGNRLTSVTHDNGAKTLTYNYDYDSNGNMTVNSRRNWRYIHNSLNLLSHIIDQDAGIAAYYIWLADGTKYAVQNILSGQKIRIYKGSFTYDGVREIDVESVLFSQGQFLPTGTGDAATFTPNYTISDHLGSSRVVINSAGSTLYRNSYYPFGLTHYDNLYNEQWIKGNRLLFNGKEKQQFITNMDYQLLDYGARMYEPIIGRWLTQDPAHQLMNPYVFCGNNPVNFIDPDGEWFLGLIFPGIGTVVDMALWGATIGAASYTVATAFSEGGFDNWNWKDFGKSVGFGALSGMTTYTVGALFGGFGGFGNEMLRALVHGYTNGCISAAAGGNFKGGFAAGFLSSVGGSAVWSMGLGESAGLMYGLSGLGGIVGAAATGDNIWKGLTIGLMTAGMNHLQQSANNWLSYKTQADQAAAIIKMLVDTREMRKVDIRAYFKNFPKGGNGVVMRNVTVMVNGEPVNIRHMDIANWPNIVIDREPSRAYVGNSDIHRYRFYNYNYPRTGHGAMGISMNSSETRGIEILESILFKP